jgi:hypothetical protein
MKSNKKSVTKICLYCRKHFKVFYCHQDRHLFCSKECKKEFGNGVVRFHKNGDKKGYYEIRINGHMQKYHRYLMEKYLGRKLKRTELIHHIDGNSLNNDIKNLMIVTLSEHMALHKTILSHWTCQWCGDDFVRNGRRYRKFCSHSCTSRYGNSLRRK